jgi:Serine kinase of the HPr protein, regulates carbohydrate metabolism
LLRGNKKCASFNSSHALQEGGPAMTIPDYFMCGWRVRSERALPELALWAGACDAPVDVVVRFAPVDSLPDFPTGAAQWLSVDDERITLCIPGVARYLIEGGRQISVDITGDPDAVDWRTFLLGITFGYLCHQRDGFALHASAVSIRGRALAIVGRSGSGKSTAAMALVRRGHTLLTDDLTVLDCSEDGVFVHPAFPGIKLWRDSLEAGGHVLADLERVRGNIDKFVVRPAEPFTQTPHRLDAIVVLREGPNLQIETVRPIAAIPLLNRNIARPHVGKLLNRQGALLAETGRIASRVPVMRFIRPLNLAQLEAGAELLERAVAS